MHVCNRQIHLSVGILEYPQILHLAWDVLEVVGSVAFLDSRQHEKPRADLADETIVDTHPLRADTLDDGSHTLVSVARSRAPRNHLAARWIHTRARRTISLAHGSEARAPRSIPPR